MHSESRDGAQVVWLAVHTTEGIMRATALRDWTTWAGSSHASSDETGALLTPADGFVPYDLAAWTLRAGNHISENIEQCGWARWSRDEWLSRPLLLDATARWLADRSQARGIPLVRLSAADIRAHKPGVLGHGDYTAATGDGTHTDPGPNYPWDVVLSKAIAYRNGTGGFLMALTDTEQAEVLTRLRALDAFRDWAWTPDDGSAFPNSKGELTKRVRSIDIAVAMLLAREGKISAADIAAAIPADIAQQVVDALGAKLSNPAA